MKVHLGAFDQPVDGWINTDITPHIWISKIPFLPFIFFKLGKINKQKYFQHKNKVFNKLKYLDITKPLPFPSNSVSAFYSSHVFEHLFLNEVEALIKEIYRCLIPGGVCRVVVPDLEKIIALYDCNNPRDFIVSIYEKVERSNIKNSHHCAFTGSFLKKLFKEGGFEKVSVFSYKVGSCPDLQKLDNRPESLFFEANK
ncbi:methyltransferase domain-containing protein [Thermodesulfobacteriota bacterium]